MTLKVSVRPLDNFPPTNQLPVYQTEGSAGMDIQSAEAFWIPPGRTAAIKTGLAFAVPDGFEMQIRSRSGLAAKRAVFVTNGVGTIDSDYRGEVMVILTNLGKDIFQIEPGDRIAQLVFAPVHRAELERCAELPTTARGVGGFGSTGR